MYFILPHLMDGTGDAAHLADFSVAFDLRSEARQQFSIERLVIQLGEDVACVCIGDAVVALPNHIKRLLVHMVL